MAQKCAQGLQPEPVGNEPVLICLCVWVCVGVCNSGMTSLADAYLCACLALFFLFLYGKGEEQVCECVWLCMFVFGGRNKLSCAACLLVCLVFASCSSVSPVCVPVRLSDLSLSLSLCLAGANCFFKVRRKKMKSSILLRTFLCRRWLALD